MLEHLANHQIIEKKETEMSNIRNVFVSHIHEDDAEVNNLKSLLRDKGMQVRDYSVTKDNPNSAKNIDYIRQKILKPRLDASGTLAVILSQDMFDKNSEHVEWEVEQAYKAGKPVIGIWAHGEKGIAHLAFRHGQKYDFRLTKVDQQILMVIKLMVEGYEAEDIRLADWEDAIVQAYRVFRKVKRVGQGKILIDRKKREIKTK